MDCKELMVGDWFKAVDYNSPFRITAIYDDVVQTQADYQSEIDGNWYSEAEIKDLVPIPLTEEILTKNGWFALDEYRYEGDVALAKESRGFRLKNTNICVNSVHQLQHLLRLCGIEKELTI